MYYQELQQAWGKVRKSLLPLLTTVHFGATPGRAVLESLEAVRNQDGRAKLASAMTPLDIVGGEGDVAGRQFVQFLVRKIGHVRPGRTGLGVTPACR